MAKKLDCHSSSIICHLIQNGVMISFVVVMVLTGMIVMLTPAFADDFSKSFQSGLNTGKLHQESVSNALKNFSPSTIFKNYTTQPNESHYYEGVQQQTTNVIQDAEKESKINTVATTIQESHDNRPYYPIDPQSPAMHQSVSIENNATAIVNGISNDFTDCTAKQTCTMTYETKMCTESPSSTNQYCKQTLIVDMVPKTTSKVYHFDLILSTTEHNYASVIKDLSDGHTVNSGPHDLTATLQGRLPAGIDFKTLKGAVTKVYSNNGTTINSSNPVTFAIMNDPKKGTIYGVNVGVISSSHKVSIDISFDITSTIITYVPNDHWNDGCLGLASNSTCTFQGEQCLEANTTHTIQGYPVSRSCWDKEVTYLCSGGDLVGNCQPLRDQGCEQIGSECDNKTAGGCTHYQQTLRCPTKQCTDNGVICNGTTYCITDDCMDHTKTADPDFQQAVSALSAVDAAAKDFDQGSSMIFVGKAKSCRRDFVGFANCCSEEGWGMDMNLAVCEQEEKDLGLAKQNGVTVYIGEYCDKDLLGVCTVYRKAYCVFTSKLGRIIQDQGRKKQLGMGFGSGEHPNCSGITSDQLASIDFGKLDFTDFYNDIYDKQSLQNPTDVNTHVQNEVDQLVVNTP